MRDRPQIAVLIPCFNEQATVGRVVADFRAALPDAAIHVCDNNSSDDTARQARAAGAQVLREPLQGKGNAVRRLFTAIDADIYVLVDGDATYDAGSAADLVETMLRERLDLVNGRRATSAGFAYRPGHHFGNRVLTGLVARVFGRRIGDMLSGYKVLSRRFVESFPALSTGFEIETELVVHALELRMPVGERPTPYYERPAGSVSKLRTFRDGFRILRLIFRLIKEERPLAFFAALCGVLGLLSLGIGLPVVFEFLATGLVLRLPTAVLATGIMLLAFLALTCGLILDTVTRGRREVKRLHYLSISGMGRHLLDQATGGAGEEAQDATVPGGGSRDAVLPLR